MNDKNVIAKIENEIKRERDDKKRFKARLAKLCKIEGTALNRAYLDGVIISQTICIDRLERVLKVVNEN